MIDDEGTVVAACRYLDAAANDIDLPLGLGSRHLAAASISRKLGVTAIVVSESAVVRTFHQGAIAALIIPELWLLARYQKRPGGTITEDHAHDLAIVTGEPIAKLTES